MVRTTAGRTCVIMCAALMLTGAAWLSIATPGRALLADSSTGAADGNTVTGILGALREEVKNMEDQLSDKTRQEISGLTFITGRLHGRRVVLAQSGIGKVNASMTAAVMVSQFHPREVLFAGISGGVSDEVRPGDIVIAAKTAQHDYGVITDKGFQAEMVKDPVTGADAPRFLPADAGLLRLAQGVATELNLKKMHTSAGDRQPAIRTGVVVTGDVFVASKAKKEELRAVFHADAVEMEGAAVAQVCARMNVPCLVIRSVSDSADASAEVDMSQFIRAAADNSSAMVIEMAKRLAAAPAGGK